MTFQGVNIAMRRNLGNAYQSIKSVIKVSCKQTQLVVVWLSTALMPFVSRANHQFSADRFMVASVGHTRKHRPRNVFLANETTNTVGF